MLTKSITSAYIIFILLIACGDVYKAPRRGQEGRPGRDGESIVGPIGPQGEQGMSGESIIGPAGPAGQDCIYASSSPAPTPEFISCYLEERLVEQRRHHYYVNVYIICGDQEALVGRNIKYEGQYEP